MSCQCHGLERETVKDGDPKPLTSVVTGKF